MSRLSRRTRFIVALAIGCCAISLSAAVVLATFDAPRPGAVPVRAAPAALDRLRGDASLGDADASALLATRLLDRFEAAGNKDDLYEAVQWIARDWDQPAYVRSDLVNRLVLRHCDRPVVKWNTLCSGGD